MNDRFAPFRVITCSLAAIVLAAGCNPAADEPGTDTLRAQPGAERAAGALRQACTPAVDHVVINELMVDPDAVGELNGEWIEIHNPTDAAIDLQGLWLRDVEVPGSTHRIALSTVVSARGYAVLCRNGDSAANGGVNCKYVYGNDFPLVNGGDAVRLCTDANCTTVVDEVTYAGNAPTGASLELRNPALPHGTLTLPATPDDPAAYAGLAWAPGTTPMGGGDRGTPGARNGAWQDVEDPACDDGDPCTVDVCDGGTCTPRPRAGCCADAGDCDDGNGCTTDGCDVANHACTHDAIPECCATGADCVDANPCNQDFCNMGRCAHSSGNVVAGCCYADAATDPRSGQPWADGAARQLYADGQCDDKNVCTRDWCDQATNLCNKDAPRPDCCQLNEHCDDGDPCTYDQCWNHVCANPPVATNCCDDNGDCDDHDPCTDDLCGMGSCRHIFNASNCCQDNEWCVKHSDDGNPCTEERCVPDVVTGRRECQHPYKANCSITIPYLQTFDGETLLTATGWKVVDYGTPAKAHWMLDQANGDLGPDSHVLFTWTPTTPQVESVLTTPSLDATISQKDSYNYFGATTLQWRMAYRHSQPGSAVVLKVVATSTSGFSTGSVLWSARTTEDIPYALYTAELPTALKFSPTLKIGFVVDTEEGTTFAMDALEIDDIKIAAGRPNEYLSAKVFKCPNDGRPCTPDTGTLVAQGQAPDPVPTLTGGVCDWYRVYLCMHDADARYFTWQYFGFPASFVDGAPLDHPDFITSAYNVGQANGCETLGFAVKNICGVPAENPGYFYCALDVRPGCDADAAGFYRSALVIRDEYDNGLPLHSPFETQVKFDVNVLLQDGYLIWSPNGRDDAGAIALKDALQAAGRQSQIVASLDLVTDLTPFDGVFALLGVQGRLHALSVTESSRLSSYLQGGGRLYLESGDFFWNQKDSSLLPLLKAEATSDGVAKIAGTLTGRGFLLGYDFGAGQGPAVNSWNDRLVHVPGGGGLEVLRATGTSSFATMVAYDGDADVGYRTVASSFGLSGLVSQAGGKTYQDLIYRLVDFLENGRPPCSAVSECEDDEVCTDDACAGGACVNAPRPACVPCQDDAVRPDGTASCDVDQACDVARGYCVDIPHEARFDGADGSCGRVFGSSPTSVACQVAVQTPGVLESVHVKVGVNHASRGQVQLTLVNPLGTRVKVKAGDSLDFKRNVYATYDAGVPSAQPLAALAGQAQQGTWSLLAEDLDPAVTNGLLEGFRLFTTFAPLSCGTVADCPPDPCAPSVDCVDSLCQYVTVDCDDGQACTVDSCSPATGLCVHEAITGSGCACTTHDQCPEHEACLGPSGTAACDPVGDLDCACAAVDGTPHPLATGLPAAIPDNDPAGVTRTLALSDDGYVKTMHLRVRATHADPGQLQVRLCRGTTCATLRNLRAGAAANLHDVYDLDPVDGPGALADFRGLALAGDWELTVADRVPTGIGQVTGMTLYTTTADCFRDADCNDGNACTVDTCLGAAAGGTCQHTVRTCEPSDDPCTAQVCNPQTGACGIVEQPNGTPCEDGRFCTVDDACQSGACVGGPARDCSGLSTTCVVGTCSDDLSQCVAVDAAEGTACDDGEPCNGGDRCVQGACEPGSVLACACQVDGDCADDGNLCNGTTWKCNAQKLCELTDEPVVCDEAPAGCTRNACDPGSGTCTASTRPDGWPCEDGLYCTVSDRCAAGTCIAGTVRDCSSLDADCATGACDESGNLCRAQPKAEGAPCERDGLGCTADTCQSGVCAYAGSVDCPAPGGDCNVGLCQDLGWAGFLCTEARAADGTACADEPDPCTMDRCQAGQCRHERSSHCGGPCGGAHPFDGGDDHCGVDDSCQGGIDGAGAGYCVPTCSEPSCVKVASGTLDLPIADFDVVGSCTVSTLQLNTAWAFVEGVEAKVLLDHGYLGDLAIDLVDPQGQAHRLWNHVGGSNAHMANTFDLSFPVPYPGLPTSGQAMCGLTGERASGAWTLRICDTGAGNGGLLREWSLHVRGSNDPNLNRGHRCEDAIDLGNQDVYPAIAVDGTTECAMNSVVDSGCGGHLGPDRVYAFNLGTRKHVSVRLQQQERDLIAFLKTRDGVTCGAGSLECAQLHGAGSVPESLDLQLDPGDYYLGVDTAGGPYDAGDFRFSLRVRTLLADGEPCIDPTDGPQDLDCLSQHCQNGYCCSGGDCCPGGQWTAPADGEDPDALSRDPEWISARDACSDMYRQPATCNDADVTDPANPVNDCQGQRYDANCVAHVCTKVRVDDDSACDGSVEADRCDRWTSVACGGYGPLPPAVQARPPCPAACDGDARCDANAHCDPVVATDPDETGAPWTMTCVPDRANGATCNEAGDCVSNHCQNGFCCETGDCCPTDEADGIAACGGWAIPPSCDSAATCEGHRYDPVCTQNQCGRVLVRDDCGCGGVPADNCGQFVGVSCDAHLGDTNGDGVVDAIVCPSTAPGGGEWIGGRPACATSCLTGGVEDDTKCDQGARCDPDPENPGEAICLGAVANGQPCNENSDCANKASVPGGHCSNGFCCDSGDCCARASDCPGTDFLACDDWAACQGHASTLTCADFRCGQAVADDDSGCVADPAHPADECGFFLPVYCSGAGIQGAPTCPTTCTDSGDCDPNGRCMDVSGTKTCVERVVLPETCNGEDDDLDGDTDEGLGTTSCGVGACAHTVSNCVAGAPVVCDPLEGRGTETCNGIDDDCDNATDEGLTALFYRDLDSDGYGDALDSVEACDAPAGYVADGTDCDDTHASCHQGAVESCDGLDNDCDTAVDEATFGRFITRTRITATDAGPVDVVVGELNNDGYPDIVTTSYTANTIHIFRSDGKGGYKTDEGWDLGTGTAPSAVAIGDLDQNGLNDIVVVKQGANEFSVLWNDTVDGTFVDGGFMAVGTGPTSVVVADLNADTWLDIAVAEQGGNSVGVILGTGNGNFGTRSGWSIGTGTGPFWLAAGDVNQDGKPDLAVANVTNGTVKIMRNNLPSGWADGGSFSVGGSAHQPYSVALSDVNLDGKKDVLTANKADGSFSVLINQTVGATIAFATRVKYSLDTGAQPTALTVADLDGNGSPDVATASSNATTRVDSVSVFLNNGDGTFPARVDYEAGSAPKSVASGDVDHDGDLDLFAVEGTDAYLDVLQNDGDGTFFAWTRTATAKTPDGVAVEDLDGDGKEDLITAGMPSSGTPYVNVHLARHDAVFGFDAPTPFALAYGAYAVGAADLDGDGKKDLVLNVKAASNHGLSVFRNTSSAPGSVTFATRQDIAQASGSGPWDLAVGDLDADGKPDVVSSISSASLLSVRRNTSSAGSISFAAQATVTVGSSPHGVAMADINRDGKADVLTAATSGNVVSILRNTTTTAGSITFATKQDFAVGTSPWSIAVADFDNDGDADVASANRNSVNLSVLKNTTAQGATTFTFVKTDYALDTDPDTANQWYELRAADLNGDGWVDLAVSDLIKDQVQVLMNKGDGTFTAWKGWPVGLSPSGLAVSDVDADGRPDLVSINRDDSTVSVLLNTCLPEARNDCDDGNDCTDDAWDVLLQACGGTAKPDGTACGTGGLCQAGACTYVLAVTRTNDGGGTVTHSGTGLNCGTTCSVRVAAGTQVTMTGTVNTGGSSTVGWSGCDVSTSSSCTVTVTGDRTVNATFRFPVTVTKTGTGTVTSSPTGINCGSGCSTASTNIIYGTAVTLTSVAGTGYSVSALSNACTATPACLEGTAPCSFTVTAAKTLAVTFAANSTRYRDADGDTYGSATDTASCQYLPTGYVANSTDCDDTNAAVKPGATETCNGVDDNCSGATDEGDTCIVATKVGIDIRNPQVLVGSTLTDVGGCDTRLARTLNWDIYNNQVKPRLDADTAAVGQGGKWTIYPTRTSSSTPDYATRLAYLNSNAVDVAVIVSVNWRITNGTAVQCDTAPPAGGKGYLVHKKVGAPTGTGSASDLGTRVLNKMTALFPAGTANLGVVEDNGYLQKDTSMPTVMVWPGFLTYRTEKDWMNLTTTTGGQRLTANAILNALQTWKGYAEYTPP